MVIGGIVVVPVVVPVMIQVVMPVLVPMVANGGKGCGRQGLCKIS